MTTRTGNGTQRRLLAILVALTASGGVSAQGHGYAPLGGPQPGPIGQLLVYPKNGASSVQQANDRYECETAATDKTGFDPEKENGGVSADAAPAKRSDYFRVEAACLEARGYSVR